MPPLEDMEISTIRSAYETLCLLRDGRLREFKARNNIGYLSKEGMLSAVRHSQGNIQNTHYEITDEGRRLMEHFEISIQLR